MGYDAQVSKSSTSLDRAKFDVELQKLLVEL